MKYLTEEEQKLYNSLSKEEKKILNSILAYFPATAFLSAYDAAINGGVKFQFIPT